MNDVDIVERQNSPELRMISDEEIKIISHLYHRLNQYHYELIPKRDLTPVPNHPEDQINIVVSFFKDLNEELGIEAKDISNKIKSGEYSFLVSSLTFCTNIFITYSFFCKNLSGVGRNTRINKIKIG